MLFQNYLRDIKKKYNIWKNSMSELEKLRSNVTELKEELLIKEKKFKK